MGVKILLVNAINKERLIERKYPALGLGYLFACLRARFGEQSVACRIIDDNPQEEIARFKPDIVGISSVTQNYTRACAYATVAKQHGCLVVCGGVHISTLPASLSADMDIAVIGEGERTMEELVGIFMEDGCFPREKLLSVRGVVFRDHSGRLISTGERERIPSLDTLPLPARDLFDIRGDTYMFTSRGCPYRCVFCASSRYWCALRFFSAAYVVNEIETLVTRYGVKRISFYDDLFTADRIRLREILSLLKARALIGRVSFFVSLRANTVTEEVVGMLKEMGVGSVGLGLESGCQRTLSYLKAGSVKVEDNERSLRIVRSFGIQPHCSFIIGSPTETKEEILQTVRFIRRNRLSSFDVYALTPFPGTPVWEDALERGLVSDHMEWERLAVDFGRNWLSAVIVSRVVSRRQLYRLYRTFVRLRRRIELSERIKAAVRRPWKIPLFIWRRLVDRRR